MKDETPEWVYPSSEAVFIRLQDLEALADATATKIESLKEDVRRALAEVALLRREVQQACNERLDSDQFQETARIKSAPVAENPDAVALTITFPSGGTARFLVARSDLLLMLRIHQRDLESWPKA